MQLGRASQLHTHGAIAIFEGAHQLIEGGTPLLRRLAYLPAIEQREHLLLCIGTAEKVSDQSVGLRLRSDQSAARDLGISRHEIEQMRTCINGRSIRGFCCCIHGIRHRRPVKHKAWLQRHESAGATCQSGVFLHVLGDGQFVHRLLLLAASGQCSVVQ